MLVTVPVSVGELFDKITILRVKHDKIEDAAKRRNIAKELGSLESASPSLGDIAALGPLIEELTAINERLWDIEEGKRECERRQDFGPAFIELARAVYRVNDRRAAVKRSINDLLGSEIVEEKSYKAY